MFAQARDVGRLAELALASADEFWHLAAGGRSQSAFDEVVKAVRKLAMTSPDALDADVRRAARFMLARALGDTEVDNVLAAGDLDYLALRVAWLTANLLPEFQTDAGMEVLNRHALAHASQEGNQDDPR